MNILNILFAIFILSFIIGKKGNLLGSNRRDKLWYNGCSKLKLGKYLPFLILKYCFIISAT